MPLQPSVPQAGDESVTKRLQEFGCSAPLFSHCSAAPSPWAGFWSQHLPLQAPDQNENVCASERMDCEASEAGVYRPLKSRAKHFLGQKAVNVSLFPSRQHRVTDIAPYLVYAADLLRDLSDVHVGLDF